MSSFRRRLMMGKKKEYIKFEDPWVERICIANWSSDGVGLTYEDAERVTDLGTVFKGNTYIVSFNEFQYFKGLLNYNNVFEGCTSLLEITLPDNMTIIRRAMFSGCNSLKNIYGIENIKHIEDWGLNQLSSYTKDIVLPNLESLGENSLRVCAFVNVLNLGTVKVIPFSCFYKCPLKKIIIPNTVTEIGYTAVADALTLEFLDIPENVSVIGGYAFSGQNLVNVIFRPITPPSFGTSIFGSTYKPQNIYVPDESVEAYKTAANFSSYANLIKPLSEYVES